MKKKDILKNACQALKGNSAQFVLVYTFDFNEFFLGEPGYLGLPPNVAGSIAIDRNPLTGRATQKEWREVFLDWAKNA